VSEATHEVIEREKSGIWDDAPWGHAVELTVPQSTHAQVPNDALGAVCARLKDDLNKLCQTPSEYICRVSLEPGEGVDGVRAPADGAEPPDGGDDDVWGQGEGLRVFLSHREKAKTFAHNVKKYLSTYGVRSFVAHDDIEPSTEWMGEIERALQSMDAFVALITDGFHKSPWVDQEAGYALAKGVPIVALKLERTDPGGFLNRWQALRSSLTAAGDLAEQLFSGWVKGSDTREKALLSLAHALLNSGSYGESRRLAAELAATKSLPPAVAQVVQEALDANRQVYKAYGVPARLKPLLGASGPNSEEASG
jgi:hypothetical protein